MRISIRACARRREASAGSPRNPSTSPTSHRWAGGLVRDATGVARLERGEVDAADNVRRLFFWTLPDGGSERPLVHDGPLLAARGPAERPPLYTVLGRYSL